MKKIWKRVVAVCLRVKVFPYRVLWNKRLRWRMWREGGRQAFLLRRIKIKDSDHWANKNLQIHARCYYSVYNGRWCSLPCLFCKKFKDVRVSKN